MIDLAILRQQVELGATPSRIVELVEQMLAEQSVLDFVVKQGLEKSKADRKRDIDRIRAKRYRCRKRSAKLSERDASVTVPPPESVTQRDASVTNMANSVTIVADSVTQRDATPPLPPPSSNSTSSGEIPPFETGPCKEDDFPDFSLRFVTNVTDASSVTERHSTASHSVTDGNSGEESVASPLPCQATLFPLGEFKEEERKRTKKKEEVNDLSVSKKEEVFKCARAREATPQPRSRGSRPRTALPDDWKLPEVWFAWAERQGLSSQQVMLESFRFADSARAHNRIYADWNAAWRNWVRSPYRHTGPPAEPFDVRRHIV